jgi:hypothetical protein
MTPKRDKAISLSVSTSLGRNMSDWTWFTKKAEKQEQSKESGARLETHPSAKQSIDKNNKQ